jgi:hypothetical protein
MEKWIEKYNALSVGEKIILPAGVVLFILGFLPWSSASATIAGITVKAGGSSNAWSHFGAFWSILAILIGLAMAAVVALKAFGTATIPDNVGGITWPKIHLGAGVAALVFLLIKFLGNHDYTTFGLYLGIIAAAALAAGGFFMFREESAAAA